MKRLSLITILVSCLFTGSTVCHASPLKDPVLEHLAGTWVLRGTIAGKQTTHDVVAEWVLDHEYLRIHEISREKDDQGKAKYEAIVLIGWDEAVSEFQILWLDTTGGGGLAAEGIGHGKRSGDAIPFIFKDPKGHLSFQNTFSYDRATDSWSWEMDNIEGDQHKSFGRVRLAKK